MYYYYGTCIGTNSEFNFNIVKIENSNVGLEMNLHWYIVVPTHKTEINDIYSYSKQVSNIPLFVSVPVYSGDRKLRPKYR
jgi:hypothetical protein